MRLPPRDWSAASQRLDSSRRATSLNYRCSRNQAEVQIPLSTPPAAVSLAMEDEILCLVLGPLCPKLSPNLESLGVTR